MKAIIFDMDGVLIDSTSLNHQSFNMILKKYNAQISENDTKKYLGRSLRDQIQMWREDYNIEEEINFDEFSKEAFKYQLELIKGQISPNVEFLNFLDNLKEQGIKIAVATSSGKERAVKILESLGILDKLDTLVTAEDVEKHKPHPDIFLEAGKRINIEPDECIVVEDAINGIEAANSANMKSIAMLTKFHSEEDFKEIANTVINSLNELNLERINNL